METQGVDLKNQINAKKEELNSQLENGIGKETLKKSQELDELIVEYMLKYEKNLK